MGRIFWACYDNIVVSRNDNKCPHPRGAAPICLSYVYPPPTPSSLGGGQGFHQGRFHIRVGFLQYYLGLIGGGGGGWRVDYGGGCGSKGGIGGNCKLYVSDKCINKCRQLLTVVVFFIYGYLSHSHFI